QQAGGGAGRLRPGGGPLEQRDGAADLRQLVRRRTPDDAAPDDEDLHASASRNRRVAKAGDSAARIAEIAATPRAPAARTSFTRSGVIPPIATTGTPTAAATRSSVSRPWGGPYRRLEGVSYTGPTT